MVKFIRNLKASEFGMRIREKFFPSKKNDPATTAHLEQSMNRFLECNHKKNASQIKKEIQICKKYWKCYPYHYYTQDLYRKDKEITKEELINFIPHFFYIYLFLPFHASPKFSMIANNKIITDHIFNALKINKPETLCSVFNGKLYASDMLPCSYEQVHKQICENDYEKIFVKPADGAGGKGIYIFHKMAYGGYETRENLRFNDHFLEMIGKNNNYIIQPGLLQNPEISKIYPHSVNTCRIITENNNGTVRLVCAMLRVGRGHNDVDNASSGGICTNININNGKFGDFAISYEGEKFSKHPDTQFAFSRYEIPRWEDIEKFTMQSAGKLPFFRYLGWDIALTTQNPVVIEINSSPAVDIIEKTCCGLRERFGIDDPDYYWKNTGRKLR